MSRVCSFVGEWREGGALVEGAPKAAAGMAVVGGEGGGAPSSTDKAGAGVSGGLVESNEWIVDSGGGTGDSALADFAVLGLSGDSPRSADAAC